MKLIFSVMFMALKTSALKLECKVNEDHSKCIIEDIPNPTNEPVEFPNMDPQIKELTIKNCSTSAIPTNLFVNFSSITSLTIIESSNLKRLGAARFKNANNLANLILEKNGLQVLKNGIFKNAPHLFSLDLGYNKIKNVGINTFLGLTSLAYFSLSGNLLKNIKVGVFDHSPDLYFVEMKSNYLTKISKTMFRYNFQLGYLYFENNQISDIENGTFDNLLSLYELNLSNNKLIIIGKTEDNQKHELVCNNNLLQTYMIGTSQQEVNICNNSITTLQCGDASPVQKICANRNLLTSMNCIRDMNQLTELDLSYNKLTKLAKVAFSKLINLIYIDLSHNLFKKLSPQLFSKLTALTTLKVDKLAGYKMIKSVMPSLTTISLSTKNCSSKTLQNIAATVKLQEINVNFDD